MKSKAKAFINLKFPQYSNPALTAKKPIRISILS